jgi:hypothetical protein
MINAEQFGHRIYQSHKSTSMKHITISRNSIHHAHHLTSIRRALIAICHLLDLPLACETAEVGYLPPVSRGTVTMSLSRGPRTSMTRLITTEPDLSNITTFVVPELLPVNTISPSG